MPPLSVLIADDHPLVLAGLADLVRSAIPAGNLVLAESCATALKQAAGSQVIDLAIVDLFMQDMDGFQFLRKLCNLNPEMPVLVMSASTNPTHIRRAFDCGVSGYLPKSVTQDVFLDAINTVQDGGVFVPSAELTGANTKFDNKVANQQGDSYTLDEVRAILTDRQQDVLVCLKGGLSNKHIARTCGLSENTVKTHVSAILRALGLNNRTEAGLLAEKLGL